MSLLDTLKAKLDPELFAQVTDALGDDFDYDLVTRARLNTVIGQREAAKRAAQRQQQNPVETPETYTVSDPMSMFVAMMQQYMNQQSTSTGHLDSVGTSGTASLTTSAADVLPGQLKVPDEAAIQARIDDEVRKQVVQVKQQYVITEKLRTAGAVDPSLILNGGLLDQSQLKWNTDDPTKLEGGFDEQLTSLKENRAYLFPSAFTSSGAVGTGREGNPGSLGTVNSVQDYMKLPYQQQLDFKAQHPETFQRFMAQAGFAGLIGGDN